MNKPISSNTILIKKKLIKYNYYTKNQIYIFTFNPHLLKVSEIIVNKSKQTFSNYPDTTSFLMRESEIQLSYAVHFTLNECNAFWKRWAVCANPGEVIRKPRNSVTKAFWRTIPGVRDRPFDHSPRALFFAAIIRKLDFPINCYPPF